MRPQRPQLPLWARRDVMTMVRNWPVVPAIETTVLAGVGKAVQQQLAVAQSAQLKNAFAGFTAIHTTVMAAAVAALRELAEDEVLRVRNAWDAAADEELDTYDFTQLLEPANRWQLQAAVALLVFAVAALIAAENYEVASAASTLTGVSPHLLAATAWWLTGQVLQHLHDRLE